MKDALQKMQTNASDEQKLTFAFIASASLVLLIAVLWFSFSAPTALTPQKESAQDTQEQEGKQPLVDKETRGASAINTLNKSFFEITNGTRANQEKAQEQFKRQPVKIEI